MHPTAPLSPETEHDARRPNRKLHKTASQTGLSQSVSQWQFDLAIDFLYEALGYLAGGALLVVYLTLPRMQCLKSLASHLALIHSNSERNEMCFI